jgi:medium-chain acyl-[acyl-carrier-protein] hydrolase
MNALFNPVTPNGNPFQEPWPQTYRLRHSDLDRRGRLSVEALCRLFQESASLHAHALGMDNSVLRPEGLAWVLTDLHLAVETSRVALERMTAFRDYRLLDRNQKTLALGMSAWVMLHIQSRRPVLPPPYILSGYPKNGPRILPGRREKFILERSDVRKSFRADITDIDENDHVNHICYLIWLINTVPEDTAFSAILHEFKISFRAESFRGDELVSALQEEKLESGVKYVHCLSRAKDNQVVCRAESVWFFPDPSASVIKSSSGAPGI